MTPESSRPPEESLWRIFDVAELRLRLSLDPLWLLLLESEITAPPDLFLSLEELSLLSLVTSANVWGGWWILLFDGVNCSPRKSGGGGGKSSQGLMLF